MTVAARVGWVGTAMAVTLAIASLAWRDCLLLLTAGVLAHQVILFRLSAAAVERPLRSVLDVWMAGLAVAAAAALMGSCLLFASLGWWSPTIGNLALAATATLAAVGWSLWSHAVTGDGGWRIWPWVGCGVLIASWAVNRGLLIAPCMLMLLTGSVLAGRGWHMACEATSSLGEGR